MTALRKSIQIVLLFIFLLGLSFAGSSLARAVRPAMAYKVVKTVKLGGDGGWDCLTVDSQARRLYISRGTHVMVVNSDTGEVVGDIPGTNGVHGIAVVRELGKGFTSNGRDNSVTVFDLQTLKPSKQIPVGKNPDAIIYDPAAKL